MTGHHERRKDVGIRDWENGSSVLGARKTREEREHIDVRNFDHEEQLGDTKSISGVVVTRGTGKQFSSGFITSIEPLSSATPSNHFHSRFLLLIVQNLVSSRPIIGEVDLIYQTPEGRRGLDVAHGNPNVAF